jgi:large subunit ribosomal protein L18
VKENEKHLARKMRHVRVRKKVKGSNERPRLAVFKSSMHIYAQIIDDESSRTLTAVSTLSPKFREKQKGGRNIAAAKIIGELIAQDAASKGIKKVVFDRGGYLFHGRVKALAESAREGGLEF